MNLHSHSIHPQHIQLIVPLQTHYIDEHAMLFLVAKSMVGTNITYFQENQVDCCIITYVQQNQFDCCILNDHRKKQKQEIRLSYETYLI